jgi:hypothetical protein
MLRYSFLLPSYSILLCSFFLSLGGGTWRGSRRTIHKIPRHAFLAVTLVLLSDWVRLGFSFFRGSIQRFMINVGISIWLWLWYGEYAHAVLPRGGCVST